MTETGERRLLLHIGMGKTGSTALQVGFARNREQLRDLGIDYPEDDSDLRAFNGQAHAGNGYALRPWLCAQSPEPGAAEAALATLDHRLESSGSSHTTLLSSEFLILFRPDRLAELRDLMAERRIRLHVVVYVRNVAGHVFSSYSQVVKRRLYTGDLGAYVEDRTRNGYNATSLHQVLSAVSILGRSAIEVVHYDEVRDHLFPDFLERVLGISDTSGLDVTTDRINRSLTAVEIELMRRANEHLRNRRKAKQLSDLLTSLDPLGSPGGVLTEDEVDLIGRRFGAVVDELRTRVLPHSSFGIVADDVTVLPSGGRLELTDTEKALLDVAVALCNESR